MRYGIIFFLGLVVNKYVGLHESGLVVVAIAEILAILEDIKNILKA